MDNAAFRVMSSPSNLPRLPDPSDIYRKEHRHNISPEINDDQEDFNG
jgi:hypothetical protein